MTTETKLLDTRVCSKCKEEKPIELFSRRPERSGGRRSACKVCSATSKKKWSLANKEHTRLYAIKRYYENPGRHNDQQKSYVRKHRERYNNYSRTYLAKRRAHKLQATPYWGNDFFIQESYSLASLREKVTGIKWHVDHIIPLRGKNVCGLHVENNLQVVPQSWNLRKGNKYDGTDSLYWSTTHSS